MNNKKILIINSRHPSLIALFNIFEELAKYNYRFSLLANNEKILNKFKEKEWFCKKIPKFFNPNKLINIVLIFIFYPIFIFLGILFFSYFKYIKKITIVICCSWFEKIILTYPAKILKIKIIWIEQPDLNYKNINKLLSFLFRINSNNAKIITFLDYTKNILIKIGVLKKNINTVLLGIKLNNIKRQENIFDNLAQTNHFNANKKFFTVGTIIKLDNKYKTEILLHSCKKCSEIINNLQLIIVGDSEEKQNLIWLAKKMNIDNLVWFVGEQKYIKKWIDNFDIFISICDTLYLRDIDIIIKTLSSGKPIIAPDNIGVENIIQNNYNGKLINIDSSEILTQEILKLYKNKLLRKKISKQAIISANNNFNISKTALSIKNIFEN